MNINRRFLVVKCIALMLLLTWGSVYSQNDSEQSLEPLNSHQDLGVFDCPDGTKICESGESISYGQCATYFICGQCEGHLSPQEKCDVKTSATENWMSNYSDRSLLQLTLPAVHDGLMGNIRFGDLSNDCTAGANKANTRTQNLNPKELLSSGFRLFDIRPAMDFSTGSPRIYSHHGDFLADKFLGCLGYRLEEMLKATAQFLTDHPSELVILEMTHMRRINWGSVASGGNADAATRDEILKMVVGYLEPFLIKDQTLESIFNTKLSDLTRNGLGRALIIYESDGDTFTPSNGFYEKEAKHFYDNYSKTNDYNVLYYGGKNNDGKERKDQATEAWYASEKAKGEKFVYLDWTLTQTDAQAALCALHACTSIEEMSKDANWYITDSENLVLWYDQWKYLPNAVSVDYGSAKIARKIIEWNNISRVK